MKIKLSNNANDTSEINDLCDWLKTSPQLTMGPLTAEFERKFAEYIGTKYAIMVNSGSSANFLLVAAMKDYLKEYYSFVIVPALSWATTISPYIKLDSYNTILCDCNLDNLGLDLNHLEQLLKDHCPTIIQCANILGFPNDYEEIKKLNNRDDLVILEDSCETLGSVYKGRKCGTFGLASTFSFFYGHILSTIEGGMICTDDEKLATMLKMMRAHGWDRNIDEAKQKEFRNKYEITDFHAFYTFYYPGFNVRPMEIQAFLGIKQLEKIDKIIKIRCLNFELFSNLLTKVIWKPNYNENVVNFAYPMMVENRDNVVERLVQNDIECRPIVCGSMNKQPFYKEHPYRAETETPNADKLHEYGLYVPNNPEITEDDVRKICEVINQ
jgi:CDP-4-dehydro-6-deoxyglucose reductase, E1